MTYCFDLDGTICSSETDYSTAVPFMERILKINELYDQGNTIIIDTARGSITGVDWFDITKKQLDDWGVKHHKLRTGGKIAADVYVDDKGMNDKLFFKE